MMASILALEENRLPWAESSDLASTNGSPQRPPLQRMEWEDDFDIVFDLVEESLTVEDEMETYWLCRNLYKMLGQRKAFLQAQLKEIECYIWRKDSALGAHLENGNFWRWPSTSPVLMDLLRLAFAGVFRCEAVVSLWDNIIAGSAMSEVFVLAEILLSHRALLMATPANLLLEKMDNMTREIPIMNQHVLIDRALEVWQLEFGGVLQPSLSAPLAGSTISTILSSSVPTTVVLPNSSTISDVRPKMSVDLTNSNVNRAMKPRKFSHFMKL